MDEVYKPMQRLCVVHAVCSDRLIHAGVAFVSSILGKKYTADVPLDFSTLLRQSSPTIPIIIIFDAEADMAVELFTDFANRKQNRYVEVYLTANGSALERVVRKQIQKGMTLLGDDQYVFTRLNKIFDVMPSTSTLSHKLFPRSPTPFHDPPLAGVSSQSNNPAIVDQGIFSTASYATYKMRKDVKLWEVCYSMLQRVPKAYNKDYIIEKVKKIGGFTTFTNFIMKELEIMYRLLNEIKTTLTAIKVATESNLLGDQMSEHTLSVADDLHHLRIPQLWCNMSGYSAPPLTWGLGQWLTELQSCCHHFERILSLGREKMPAYWLGAFFNPQGLLALLKQESICAFSGDRSGNFEQFIFQTEVTSRDKDHLRDPPQEGMFVFGIYVWGCAWEKITGELQDSPPRNGCAALPIVHLTCWPATDKPTGQRVWREEEGPTLTVVRAVRTQDEVLDEIKRGKIFGFVQCDIKVPDHLKGHFSELQPIFKNRDDIGGSHMRAFTEAHGLLQRPRRTLFTSYFGKGILLYTPLLQFVDEGEVVGED